ncbi:MAG: hypothetical protein M3O01_06635, partial [Pseudomonadota bacterium]|nr:hypothetical protein [Pseudomonadota bacterium]
MSSSRFLRAVVAATVAASAAFGSTGAGAQSAPSSPSSPAGPAAKATSAAPGRPDQAMSHGLFTDVRIVRPAGTPRQFVLLVSANDRPDASEQALVHTMVNAGAMVAVVPLAPFYRRLEAQDGKCTYAAGAFENLSRHVQASEQLPTYLLPMVVGSGQASAFAYVLLAQAPAGTFASGMSLDFCPQLLGLTVAPCPAAAVKTRPRVGGGFELQAAAALGTPWTALQ